MRHHFDQDMIQELIKSKRRGEKVNVLVIISILLVTGIGLALWGFLSWKAYEDHQEDPGVSVGALGFVTLMIIMVTLLFIQMLSSYILFRSLLDVQQAWDQIGLTADQRRLQKKSIRNIFFLSLLITFSYLLWFVSDSTIMYFSVNDKIEDSTGVVLEWVTRMLKVTMQYISFACILHSFNGYQESLDQHLRKKEVREENGGIRQGP